MSETETKPDSTKSDIKIDEISASHYALQIALQTMKERCQLLQQRLSVFEEENLRLRLENQNYSRKSFNSVPANEISRLEEKVTQLTRQKHKLTDHIAMVVQENNQLWTRLSRVTEANQSLGNHLSKISDTLNKHPVEVSKLSESESVKNSDIAACDENKEESLEEISLKIIDTIRKEKKVLEQQCEEMVELQTGVVSVEECGFNIGSGVIEDDIDGENVMEDITELRQKMKEGFKILKMQQAGLQAAISSLNSLVAEKKKCKCKCKEGRRENKWNEQFETKSQDMTLSTLALPLSEIEKQLKEVAEPPGSNANSFDTSRSRQDDFRNNVTERNNDEINEPADKICPMCSQFFGIKIGFEEFNDHVLSHFTNTDGQESDCLINTFEKAS